MFVIVLGVLLIAGMIYNSSVLSDSFPFLSRLSTEEKNAEIASAGARLRAPVLDRNGNVVADYSDASKDGESTLTDDDYIIKAYPYAYSTLLGYCSTRYGVGGGILESLGSTLTIGTNSFLNIRNNMGNTVKMTVDSELQQYAYNLTKNNRGAVVVTNADGDILCMVSTPTYNSNDIKADESEIFTDEKYEALFYHNAYEYPRAPGSVFKMVSSVAVCESGLSKVPYYDEGVTYTDRGYAIYNSGNYTKNTTITLTKALSYSVNTYFADRINEVGYEKFNEVAKRFWVGEDIKLDFTTLTSNFDTSSENGNEELMASAYGQGKTLITPLHINMITRAVATGDMVKPHIVKQILSPGESGKIVKTIKPEVMTEDIISYDTASEIREGMLEAATNYGLGYVYYKGGYVRIAAKTGTAETDNGDGITNNYITAYFPADDPQYFVTILSVGVGYGSGLAPTLQYLCNYVASNSSSYEN